VTFVGAVFEKSTKMLKIYYTLIYLGYKSGKSGKTVGIKGVSLGGVIRNICTGNSLKFSHLLELSLEED